MPTPTAQRRRRAEPPEACSECNESTEAMRQELAAVILALLRAATEAERERLTARRNELGRRLARLVKTE